MSGPHFLEISGDPFARGRTHGGELRREVASCVDFYRAILGLGEEALVERAALFERLIEAYSPSLAEEIRGIADGAGLPAAHLFAVNARSELVPFDVGECTALYFPEEGLLGQTWDWCRQLEPLVTVLAISREDGHRVLTVTEPGIVGKIGLSSAGIGVCLNFLSAPRSADGAPIHILLREALEADGLEGACRRLREAGSGRSGNIMLGSDAGQAVNFEFSGDQADERPLKVPFSHTNHCLETDLPAGDLEENSRTRLARARALMRNGGLTGLSGMKTILSNQEDEDAPICAPYQPLFGLELGTICTVIMDLPRCQLQYRQGADPGAEFQSFGIGNPS